VNPAELVGFAHELADLADGLTLPAFRAGVAARTKGDGTPVTDVDEAVERALRARIHATFPEHVVLGEEDGIDGDPAAPTWIIDPIDGTANFIKGNPVHATLIALRADGEVVLGLASAPALGSRWDGVHGGPAHQDGREVRVSAIDRLADAEVSFGQLAALEASGHGPLVRTLIEGTSRQRGFGDFWMHCLVASGVAEVALETDVRLWDLAAVKAIVEAAGGRFTDLSGNTSPAGGSALSTNGRVHDQVLDLARRPEVARGR
jgi:histidinol-phosphatase